VGQSFNWSHIKNRNKPKLIDAPTYLQGLVEVPQRINSQCGGTNVFFISDESVDSSLSGRTNVRETLSLLLNLQTPAPAISLVDRSSSSSGPLASQETITPSTTGSLASTEEVTDLEIKSLHLLSPGVGRWSHQSFKWQILLFQILLCLRIIWEGYPFNVSSGSAMPCKKFRKNEQPKKECMLSVTLKLPEGQLHHLLGPRI
jgi:hypothetical protein